MDKAKEHILSRIRKNRAKGITRCEQALAAWGEPVCKPVGTDAAACFKQELDAINGHCELLRNEQEAAAWLRQFMAEKSIPCLFCRDEQLSERLRKHGLAVSGRPDDFADMQAGITGCEMLVARTGTVNMSSALPSGRQMHAYAPIHIVWAYAHQLAEQLGDAYEALQAKYAGGLPSSITAVTGPSRTADIEKTLVLGAHGPKELHVLLMAEPATE